MANLAFELGPKNGIPEDQFRDFIQKIYFKIQNNNQE